MSGGRGWEVAAQVESRRLSVHLLSSRLDALPAPSRGKVKRTNGHGGNLHADQQQVWRESVIGGVTEVVKVLPPSTYKRG